MNFLRKLFRHKLIFALCSGILCFAVVAACVIPNYMNLENKEESVNVNTKVDTDSEETEIHGPYHEYTSLTASLNAGALVYLDKTTAYDLKKNLCVMGSFQGASAQVELLPEEYNVSIKIGSAMMDYADSDVLFGEVPAEAVSVVVKLDNSDVVAETSIPLTSIKPLADYHSYYSKIVDISVDPVALITNDYDETALEKIIVVKGLDSSNKKIDILNKEMIKVTRLDALMVGASATFDVSYTYVNEAGNTIVFEAKNIAIQRVEQAELLAADFKVNPAYRENGMYYQKKVVEEDGTEKWFSAFVASTAEATGTSVREIYGQALVLMAYYPKSTRKVELNNITSNEYTTSSTGEYVSFGTTSFVENSNTITATIRSNITSSVGVNASINVNFEAAKIVEIETRDHNHSFDGTINSLSVPVKDYFVQDGVSFVYIRSNTGEWSTQPISSSEFAVSGKLNPSAEDVKNYLADSVTYETYLKKVTISYVNDPTVSCEYPLPVKYMEVYRLGTVDAPGQVYPTQTMLTPFNYGNLYVQFFYWNDDISDEEEIQALLSDFLDEDGNSKHIELILYKDTTRKNPILNEDGSYSKIITKDVKAISIRFRYDITKEEYTPYRNITGARLTINKYVVPLPEFNTDEVSFTTDVSKEIKFDSNLPEDITKGITMGVYSDNTYESLSDFATYNNGASTGLNTVETIKFLAGGLTYYIRLNISEELREEVEWAGGRGTNADYEVTIKRGPITPVVLEYATGEWTYGDKPEEPTIYGTKLNGERIKIVKEGSGPNILVADYIIEYYHRDTKRKVEAGEKLVVGEYYVVVVIPKTDNYEGASSSEAGYFAPIIEITPAPLSPDNLLSNITFDGQVHQGSDFVTANGATGIKYEEMGIVKADNLQSKTSGVALVDGGARHAGVYSITLSLTDSKNYMWADGAEGYDEATNTVVKEFEIEQRILELQISNESALNFVYGDSSKTDPTLKYCIDYKDASSYFDDVKPALFFAKVADAKYYLIKGSTETLITELDHTKWVAGNYKVVFETSLATGDLTGDYTLPTVSANFTIDKKEITKIDDASFSGIYGNAGLSYTIANWNNGNDNTGNPIYTWTLSGLEFDQNGGSTTTEILTVADTMASNKKIPVGTTVSAGTVQVTHAGVYTFTITLNDNYKWPVAEGQTATNKAVITITISQKVIQGHLISGLNATTDVFTWDKNLFEYQPVGEQQTPTISMYGIAITDGLTLSTELYQQGNDSVAITDKSLMEAGEYYYKLMDWTANQTAEGYSLAKNYVFPADVKIVSFTIDSADLSAVELAAKLTEIYNGSNFDFRNYITNYEAEFVFGTDKTSKLLFYVASAAANKGTALDGVFSTPNIKDTGSYKIYIYPKDNFKWEDGVSTTTFGTDAPTGIQGKLGFVAEFVITPKELTASDVEWGTTTFTFNGVSQYPNPKIKVSSLCGDDSVTTVALNQVNCAGNSVNAGTYTASLNGFTSTSTRAFNYTIEEVTKEITIKAAILKAPVWNGSKTGKFTGATQTANVTLAEPTTTVTGYEFKNSVSVSILGGWLNGETKIANEAHGATFNSDNGTFSYFNAGYYTITFTLSDSNYEWEGNVSSIVISDIQISRMQITAPALGAERTLEYDNSEKKPSFNNKEIFIDGQKYTIDDVGKSVELANGHLITWEILYGEYTSDFDDLSTSISPKNYGKYYVQLKLKKSDNSHLNYVWVQNTSDTEGMNILGDAGYAWGTTSSEQATGVSIFLAYMVTKQIFDVFIETTEQSYVFGTNTALKNTITQDSDFLTEGNFVHFIKDQDYNIVISLSPTIAFTLYSIDSLDALRGDASNKVETDLVNGLPWNKGYYGAAVTLSFDADSPYQNIPLWVTFEVTAKPIEVKWESAEASVTGTGTSFATVYDGKEHTLNASISNAPDKFVAGDASAPALTVSCTETVKNAKANPYTLKASIHYTDADKYQNYTLVNGTNTEAELSISKLGISVQGKELTNQFVYGNEIQLTGIDWWEYQTDSATIVAGDNAADILTYSFSKGGTAVSGTLAADTYELVVALTAAGQTNYELLSSLKGSIVVSPREITVQYDAALAKDEYSQATTIGTPYTILYDGGSDWLVQGDLLNEVFILILKDGALDVTSAEYNPVKTTYEIYVVKGSNANYIVHVNDADLTLENDEASLGKFEITKATLEVTGIQGNVDAAQELIYTANPYSWIGADATSSLISYENITVVNADSNHLQWWIRKTETDEWVDVTSETQTNCIEEQYMVKVTADNHEDYVLTEKVSIKISQALLKVSLNFIHDDAIYYGAEVPTLTMADLTKSIFTFTELLGEDKNKIASIIKGSFTYTTTYTQWSDVKDDYTTELDVTNLEADNYIIESEEGKLSVIPLPIDIYITSQKTAYSQNDTYLADSLKNKDFNTLYDYITIDSLVEGITLRDSKDQIVLIHTDALKVVEGKIVATNDVGKYPFYLTEGSNYSNYDATINLTGDTLSKPDEALGEQFVTVFEIEKVNNSFTTVFGFSGIDALTNNTTAIVLAWIYGVNSDIVTDGYDAASKHQVVLPLPKFNSIPNQETLNTIISYTISYSKNLTDWEELGNSENIEELIQSLLMAGKFNVGNYKVEYSLTGNDNYDDASDVRYFKVDPRDLFVWASDSSTYYGEDFVRAVGSSGLVDNGCGTQDTLAEVLSVSYIFDYQADHINQTYSDAGNYTYTIEMENSYDKYDNYNVILNKKSLTEEYQGALEVLPRPVSIDVKSLSSQYDFNKAFGETGDPNELVFSATLGENALNIEFHSTNPFLTVNEALYTNDNGIVKLYTNVFSNEVATIATQNVGNYPIYAVYATAFAKKNYVINVTSTYNRDEATEKKVEDFFPAITNFYDTFVTSYFEGLQSETEIDAVDMRIGDATKAGTYTIDAANLRIQLRAPNAPYDGQRKAATITSEYEDDSDYGNVSYHAEYLYKEDGSYKNDAPVNVGVYPVRIVVDNPNFVFNAGGTSYVVEITPRSLDWTTRINNGVNQSENVKYDSTYINASTKNKLLVAFSNIVENVITKNRLSFTYTVVGAKPTGTVIQPTADPYSSTYIDYTYDIDAATFTLNALNAGVYTIKLSLDGDEAKNYVFPTEYATNDGAYEITFNIARAIRKDVNAVYAVNSKVQYGSLITIDGTSTSRFDGFTLDPATLALLEEENQSLAGSCSLASVRYSVADYKANSTQAGEILDILPSNLLSFNYDFEYSDRGKLDVLCREIEVAVHGSTANNKHASVVYTGLLQGPDYSTYASDFFKPLDPADGTKWYGEASSDATKNFAEIFNVRLNLYADGSFGVSGGMGTNARTYFMNIILGIAKSNYKIQFKNHKGIALDVFSTENYTIDEENAPTFEIVKANLKVQAGSNGMLGDEAFKKDFSVTYGNKIEDGNKYHYLTATYEGFVNGETIDTAARLNQSELVFTTKLISGNGSQTYMPWDSHSGSKYEVIPSGLEFVNYVVDSSSWLSAVLTVEPRFVSASTANRTYAEEVSSSGAIIYNRGEEGRYHTAQIVFKDYGDAINNAGVYYTLDGNGAVMKDEFGVILPETILTYAPQYSLSYRDLNGVHSTIHSDGPQWAGNYEVTVSMKAVNGYYDYLVVPSGETSGSMQDVLTYTIYKKTLTLEWNEVEDSYLQFNVGDDKQRDIEDYINAIMGRPTIRRYYNNGFGEQVSEELTRTTGTLGPKQYAYGTDGFGLSIKIYGIGLYSAIIPIVDSAFANYAWLDSDGQEITLSFRVAADSVEFLGLTLDSWVYREEAPEVQYTTSIEVGLLYYYAKLNSLPAGFDKNQYGTMITEESYLDYVTSSSNREGYSRTIPDAVGTYLLRAHYPGSDQYRESSAYLVFEITKAVLETPKILIEGANINEDGVLEMKYTGSQLRLEIGYDSRWLDINYSNSALATPIANGMAILATDVVEGGYTISFDLVDNMNYSLEEGLTNGFVWKIIPADDNEITEFDFSCLESLTYGDGYIDPFASATYSDNVRIEYLVNDVWTTQRPTKADTYKVRAVSPATSNYFAGTAGTDAISDEVEFTIARKELVVTATGSMTYGDAFSVTGGASYGYSFLGFTASDDETAVSVTSQVKYQLVGEPSKLEVGEEYFVQLEEENGEVLGLSSDNYRIVAAQGSFVVNKRNVTLVLGDASSVYGDLVDLSKVDMRVVYGELVEGDSLADLNIQLNVEDSRLDLNSKYNPATSYKINADADAYANSKNYNVLVFGSGVYTILPLSIYITVEAGGGVYQGQINPVTLTGVYTTEDNRDILKEFDPQYTPRIRFNYWGSSNDGKWVHTNEEMWSAEPTLAGNYHATAVATQTNNYTLVTNMGTPSVSFVVERKTLDDTNRELLFAKSLAYTGSPLLPVVTDHAFEGLYNTGTTTFENVGTYSVALTLKDSYNYKWTSVDGATCEIPFEIVKGDNAFENDPSIQGWVYGKYNASQNLPTASVRFGNKDDFTFSYSTEEDGVYTSNLPTNAGTYWVKITVPQSDNYHAVTSKAISFEIEKAPVASPSLVFVQEGENQNVTYTGSRLQVVVDGYDQALMRMLYDGDSSVGNVVSIFGLNADVYKVSFTLNDSENYKWATGTSVVDGNATLEWKVNRKQIAKPTMNTNTFMVNGGTLTFIPVGFDDSTMDIEGNKTSYGGVFKVSVTIKDTVNYEWVDGSIDAVTFDWVVIGWDTVFIIVVSVLGIIAGIAGIAVIIQYAVHRRKKKKELEEELAAQSILEESMNSEAEPEAADQTEEGQTEEAETGTQAEAEDGGEKNE